MDLGSRWARFCYSILFYTIIYYYILYYSIIGWYFSNIRRVRIVWQRSLFSFLASFSRPTSSRSKYLEMCTLMIFLCYDRCRWNTKYVSSNASVSLWAFLLATLCCLLLFRRWRSFRLYWYRLNRLKVPFQDGRERIFLSCISLG